MNMPLTKTTPIDASAITLINKFSEQIQEVITELDGVTTRMFDVFQRLDGNSLSRAPEVTTVIDDNCSGELGTLQVKIERLSPLVIDLNSCVSMWEKM